MKIVVAYNQTSDAECALGWASEIALTVPAEVHLVNSVHLQAVPSHASAQVVEQLIATSSREASAMLKNAADALRARGLVAFEHVRNWLPVETILDKALEVGAELIVIGQRGAGKLKRLLIGTVSTEVVRLAPCSVLVTGNHPPLGPMRKVLVAVDGSSHSVRALRSAHTFFPKAEIVAMHVRSPGAPSAEPILRDAVGAAGLAGLNVTTRDVAGDPAMELMAELKRGGHHMIVMGRRGLGLLEGLLVGSVSEKLLQLAPCPVLLAK